MRVGKQVTIVDGKVQHEGQLYAVTWIGDPPKLTTDYIDTVGSDGAAGGNVTLLEGGTFLNPQGLRRPLQVIETYGATISFNTELCWYTLPNPHPSPNPKPYPYPYPCPDPCPDPDSNLTLTQPQPQPLPLPQPDPLPPSVTNPTADATPTLP